MMWAGGLDYCWVMGPGGPGEETASLVPGDGTVDGEACSPQNGVVVTFGEIRSFNLLFRCGDPLDPLNGDIYYECLRVDPHDGDDANLFPGFCHDYPGTLIRGGSTVDVTCADSVQVTKSLSPPR
ncbi:hypothetical protein MTP99_014354 [Tenebrio molitor]|nr:hypothetical protein MTP99_014354 [Tenebrio molitor]